MNEILGFLALCGLLSALASWLLGGRRRDWSHRQVALIAALPLPILFSAACLFVFARAALAPAEKCGAGACGMAMRFAVIGLFWAAIGYGIALGTAALVLKRLRG
ncbi:MAG TPA: hypothetical protein VF463_12610 [Sphingobium sp.]